MRLTANNGSNQAFVSNPATPAGATVTFRVWVPVSSALTAVQPYVQEGAAGNWRWSGTWRPISGLTKGAWNTITVAVPADAAPLFQLGVQFATGGANWSGTAYLDSIGW